jgi:hypothetical protein
VCTNFDIHVFFANHEKYNTAPTSDRQLRVKRWKSLTLDQRWINLLMVYFYHLPTMPTFRQRWAEVCLLTGKDLAGYFFKQLQNETHFTNSLFLSALCYISMDESYFTSIYKITDSKGNISIATFPACLQ